MLTTVEGIYEAGIVRLLEPLPGVVRARVMVTVLPEPVGVDITSLDLPLTDEERAVWEDFPRFRAAHPIRFQSLQNGENAGVPGESPYSLCVRQTRP